VAAEGESGHVTPPTRAVSSLLARVDALERQVALAAPSIEGTLRQRGWDRVYHSSTGGLLLPRPAEGEVVERYYADLTRYHFRRLLQEVMALRTLGAAVTRRLEERWGAGAVATSVQRFAAYGFLRRQKGTWAVTVPRGATFGDTLQWFVAQVFRREFAAPAAWDVRVGEIAAGGDFDVLTVLQGRLGYVECKGSPPYNVTAGSLARFLERLRRLRPEFAILFVDTTLRIDRNIIDNLARLWREDHGREARVARVTPGRYEIGEGRDLFVITGRRSLIANLRWCLRRMHAPAQ